tara:strand:- start:1060 stop:1560 length:501 start_codon:yes stop_codon:yes gene_type:complete
MALEVVEKKEGYEVAFRWISSRRKAETFCLRKLKKSVGHRLCDIEYMSRYNEIIEEFDVEVCTPVITQVRKKVEKTKSWRLYRLDLMYVYPMGEDHICHRRYATKMVVAKDDDAVIKFRNSGQWRDMKWKQLKHDMSDESPRGGWVEFEYVMDLAPGTQKNYFIIK